MFGARVTVFEIYTHEDFLESLRDDANRKMEMGWTSNEEQLGEEKKKCKRKYVKVCMRVSYICLEKSNVTYQSSTSPNTSYFTTVLNYLTIFMNPKCKYFIN